jgi:hypothetical protein
MLENKEKFLQSSGTKASREANALTNAEDKITLTESWNIDMRPGQVSFRSEL